MIDEEVAAVRTRHGAPDASQRYGRSCGVQAGLTWPHLRLGDHAIVLMGVGQAVSDERRDRLARVAPGAPRAEEAHRAGVWEKAGA